MAEEQNMTFGFKMLMAFGILCISVGAYKCTNSVFGSDKENTNATTNTTQQTETPTETNKKTVYVNGYRITVDLDCPEGKTCRYCSGTSVTVNPVNNQETLCPSCNGRGFDCK